MKLRLIVACALFGSAVCLVRAAGNSSAPATHPAATSMRFVPPVTGAPPTRVGCGTRGGQEDLPNVVVLTPNQTGFTTSKSPSLFWYISKPTNDPIQIKITLTRGTESEPVLILPLSGVAKAGFQRVDLDKLHVVLDENAVYTFAVLVSKPGAPLSSGVCPAGTVERIKSPAISAGVHHDPGNPITQATQYAAHGLFYDSLTSLQNGLDSDPDDMALRTARDALLQQVGLVQINGEIYDANSDLPTGH